MVSSPSSSSDSRPVLVIGGAGFIGSHLVDHLARSGHRIRVYDDLSRPDAERILSWLRRRHGDQIQPVIAGVASVPRLRDAADRVQAVFDLVGTVDVLDAVDASAGAEPAPPIVFASSSKIYGPLTDVRMELDGERWRPADPALAAHGLDERHPIDDHPAGRADQEVLARARERGLPAVVLRASSVYGPRQTGIEEQAWVARFLIRAIEDQPIVIHGDGRQVRDLLYVDDLVDACVRAWTHADHLAGGAYNVGGGPASTLSFRELIAMIQELRARLPNVVYKDWRPIDQRWYVSDPRAFAAATGWRPRLSPRAGVTALLGWLLDQRTGRPQTLDNLGPILADAMRA